MSADLDAIRELPPPLVRRVSFNYLRMAFFLCLGRSSYSARLGAASRTAHLNSSPGTAAWGGWVSGPSPIALCAVVG